MDNAEPYLQFTKKQKYTRNLNPKYTSTPTEILSISNTIIESTLSLLPQSIFDIELPKVFLIRVASIDVDFPVLPAHVDYNRTCGINFYIEASGETTHYYNWDNNDKKLTEIAQFCAEQGDCWLLDTSIPHSVTLKPKQQRLILTISFTHTSFAKVAAELKEFCYV
jgi:hypothetical protein